MEVRHPRPGESRQVVEMVVALLTELRAPTPLRATEGVAALEELLKHPERGTVLVAIEDGDMLGVATLSYLWALRTRGRYAILQEMYVAPQGRSKGVGALLLEAACQAAKGAGCPQIELATPGDHSPYRGRRAERFYLARGFRRVGRRLVKVL